MLETGPEGAAGPATRGHRARGRVGSVPAAVRVRDVGVKTLDPADRPAGPAPTPLSSGGTLMCGHCEGLVHGHGHGHVSKSRRKALAPTACLP